MAGCTVSSLASNATTMLVVSFGGVDGGRGCAQISIFRPRSGHGGL